VVVRQLREASELTTAVFTLETVVEESLDRRIAGLTIGRTELLYVAHGTVRAGVDLDKLADDDVVVDDRAVFVRLPAPGIHDAKIDVGRSYVYDIDRSLFGPADPDLQTRAERFALSKVLAAACEENILGQANERASIAVRALLGAAGFSEVSVEIQAPGDCPGDVADDSSDPPPDSRREEPPAGGTP
jgi:hypothetical protein